MLPGSVAESLQGSESPETFGSDTTCYKIATAKVDQTKNKNTEFYVETLNGKNHGTHDGVSL